MNAWRKSSRCSGGGCVEVAFRSASGCVGGECVEVAACGCGVRVRDSKNPDGPQLAVGRATWVAFLADVKAGRLDGATVRDSP